MLRFAFGRFVLDERQGRLSVADAPVELQGRPFEILVFLIACRDRAVAVDEIIEQVWRGRTVSRNNVTVQISALRRVLAEHGSPDCIVTRPEGRYQFVAEGEAVAEPMPAALPGAPQVVDARHRRTLLYSAFALAALLGLAAAGRWWIASSSNAPRLSIAVLPFRNLSADRSQDYLADAISDDLTTDLAHIPGSVVIAQESSAAFRNKAVPTSRIGHALGVRYLLEGSLRAEDGALWTNAQLIEASSGAHLWAQRFPTAITHMGETRNAIVRRIASALDTRLTDLEAARASDDRPSNADALGLFYHARHIAEHDDSLAALSNAQADLRHAVTMEPNFADAWAELGLILIQKIRATDDPDNENDERQAEEAIARAIQIAPHNATALAANARLRESDGNCTAAAESADAALNTESNNVVALSVLAKCAFAAGDLDAAARHTMAALDVDPEGRTTKLRHVMLAEIRLLQGHTQDAIDHAYQAISGDPEPRPGDDSLGRAEFCRLLLIAAYQVRGETARVADLYRRYVHVWPNRSTWRIAAYAPRHVATMPEYQRFMEALQAAGVKPFADERVVTSILPMMEPHSGGDFDPPPDSMPGAQTIYTAELAELMTRQAPIILDVGRGAAVIDGAAWNDHLGPDSANDAFAMRTLAERAGKNLDMPVVVMASGVYGLDAYSLGLQVQRLGYRAVYWYRGGEEAWAASKRPAHDMRLQ